MNMKQVWETVFQHSEIYFPFIPFHIQKPSLLMYQILKTKPQQKKSLTVVDLTAVAILSCKREKKAFNTLH